MNNYQGESAVIDRGNNGNGGVKILSAEEQKLLDEAVKNGDRDKYIEILQIKIIEDPHEDLSGVLYPVGQEPAQLKARIDTLLSKIEAAYPFKIVFNLSKDHKKWGETLTDLYRKLGYPSGRALLRAYGYTIAEKIFSGNNDYNKFIDLLKRKYPDGSPFTSLNDLKKDCEDLDIRWKSLQNNALKIFGMGLMEYLCSIGILCGKDRIKSSNYWDDIEKEFNAFIEGLRENYGENPPETYEQLVKDNPKIEDKEFLDYIRLKLCNTPARYFKEQGIIKKKKTEKIVKKEKLPYFDNTDFDISPRGILKKYNGNDTVVVIPYGVKKILKNAFGEYIHTKFNDIEEIVIPDSVEVIEAYAFCTSKKLKKVKLSKNLKVIETGLFAHCEELCEVEIPEGVEVINSLAFYKCNLSGKISIPSTVKTINQNPWKEIKNLEGFIVDTKNENYTSVDGVLYNKEKSELCMYPLDKMDTEFVVPDGVEKLRAGAFSYCKMLESIKIPYSVNEIGKNCFSQCIRLKNIVVPETATILNNAFQGCTALAKDGFIIINGVSYGYTSQKAEKVVVPDGVKVVKEWAFLSDYKNIFIPDSVEYVYDIPYGVEYLSVPSTLKNFDELKKMVGSRVRIVTRVNKNDNEYKKYYTMPSLEEFTGKGILLDIFDEQLKTETRAILKRFNASIKKVFSKNVDYVITEDAFAYNRRRKHSEFVEASLSNTDKTGVPMLVILDEILIENEKYIERQFVSMPKEAKLNYALSLYKVCINKVQTMMDNVGTYGEPICSGLAEIKETLSPSVNISDAYDFLDRVSQYYGYDYEGKTYEDLVKMYREAYDAVFTQSGCYLGEGVGIEVPIAVAVACFVYGTPDCNIHIEWVRDKWESRGDYSSSFNVGFELSKVFADGRVVRCSK